MKATTSTGKVVVVASRSLSLDTINAAANFFAAKWQPSLKRSQSRDVLTAIVSKLYGVSHGHIFNAHVRVSHAALGSALDLSREWTCKLIARLRAAGWIHTTAPRLPDGTQEITLFRAGRMLKRLLIMLVKSHQRQYSVPSRVNDCAQQTPTRQKQVEENKEFLQKLLKDLSIQLSMQKK